MRAVVVPQSVNEPFIASNLILVVPWLSRLGWLSLDREVVSMALQVEVYLQALSLIKEHGANAPGYAAGKANEMLHAGNLYERRTWRRVSETIGELLTREAASRPHIH